MGINLGAGSDEKRWPVRNFVSLAKRIYAKYGIIPLVFTNPGTEYLATEFEVQYGKHSQVIVVPVTPLDDVAALMSNCGYFITADTSLMHMAFGLKVPTLVLFTFTRPEMVAPEDVRFSSCFVESKSGRDYCGQPAGSVDISVNAAMQQFEQLAGLE